MEQITADLLKSRLGSGADFISSRMSFVPGILQLEALLQLLFEDQ